MTLILTREDAERAAAEKVKQLADVRLPRLDLWNYGPCKHHQTPVPDCEYQECGGELFGYQRVGVMWLYLRRHGMLADDPGLGKWVQIMNLLCLLIQRGELPRRAIFIVQTPSLGQCIEQTRRWAPNLRFEFVTGKMSKQQRIQRYVSGSWQMLIVGNHVARQDVRQLHALAPFSLVFVDDVDELLNERNVTHRAIVGLTGGAERTVVSNATNLQTKLEQLHRASLACGGQPIFGTASQFDRRYVRREPVYIWIKNRQGERVRRKVMKIDGYKNLAEFRERFLPMYLRRRLEDLEGVEIPILLPPSTVWLEMSPAQQELYDKLRQGALKLRRADGTTFSAAQTMFQSGQRICAGLPALGEPDGPGASPKLDWVMNRLTGAWSERKVVAYMTNRGMVEALHERAKAAGIGSALVWGGQSNEERAAEVERFRTDPGRRLIIGSKSIERSLNLQVANTVVAVDTVLNPARIRQLVGRLRRVGSRFSHIQLVTLMMAGTQEEGYQEVLRRRAGVSDYVFDENSGAEIFGGLSTFELLEMITG